MGVFSVPKNNLGRRSRPVRELDPMTALAVYAPGDGGIGTRCLGFIMPRGKTGFEGFDADDKSLGLFVDQNSAANAVSASWRRGGV
jgi:hypothetical protein